MLLQCTRAHSQTPPVCVSVCDGDGGGEMETGTKKEVETLKSLDVKWTESRQVNENKEL